MKRLALALALFACKPSQPPAPPAASPPGDPGSSKALLAEVDRLQEQIKNKPKTFEVVSALGNLYYENGRYLEAIDAFREAEEMAAPAQAEAQALRKKGVKPAAEVPPECRRSGPEYGLARITEAARKLYSAAPVALPGLRAGDGAAGQRAEGEFVLPDRTTRTRRSPSTARCSSARPTIPSRSSSWERS